MNSRKTLIASAAVLTTLFGTALQAQSAHRHGNYSLTVGNDWMGGSVYAGANLTASRSARGFTVLTNDSATAAVVLDASLRFLQKPRLSLVYGLVSARSQDGAVPADGTFQLTVRGIPERTQRFTTSGTHTFQRYYKQFDLFPTNPSTGTTVYGVPVRVYGNIGAGVEAYGNLSMVGPGRAGISATGRCWGYGWVRAQAGWRFFGAGADFTASFANTRLTPSVVADARNPIFEGGPQVPTIGGRITMTFQAITLRLDVWVALVVRYTKNLVSWSTAPRTIFDILF